MNKQNRIWVYVGLALAAGILIGYLVARQKPSAPPPPPAANATEQAAAELARGVDRLDEALRESLAEMHLPPAQGVHSETRSRDGVPYAFKSLRLPECDPALLRKHLQKRLAEIPGAKLAEPSAQEWTLSLAGTQTHRLLLAPEAAKPAPAAGKARLSLIIDDMGEDVKFARGLAALEAPVAFSIWPDSSHREEVLKIAKAAGREILIHLPMQPKGYPGVDPGPHPLLVSMTPDQVRAAVERAAKLVHGAIGVNNHMGSAFTESNIGMRAALQAMHEKGLFFLDSRTTAETVGEQEARNMGLRHYHRDVFLDNEQDVPTILKQLRRAEGIAKSKGQAVAIGHPHPATLAALRQWLQAKDPAVRVVPLTQLSAE